MSATPELAKHLVRGAAGVLCAGLIACGRGAPTQDQTVLGNRDQGAIEIYRAACGSCHIVPGIVGADGMAGPSLERFGKRKIVAGLLPNTPDNLARWIARPQQIGPGNAMPNMNLSEAQARDIAAYLEHLE